MWTLFIENRGIGDAKVFDRLVHDVMEHFHMFWCVAMHAAANVPTSRVERPNERWAPLDAVLKDDIERHFA